MTNPPDASERSISTMRAPAMASISLRRLLGFAQGMQLTFAITTATRPKATTIEVVGGVP
jgi:hypothetical protein